MDLFLFARYGLNLNEDNLDIIKDALEKVKNESKWANGKASSEKLKKRYEQEKKAWENDWDLLTNTYKRTRASNEISEEIKRIVGYVESNIQNKDVYENAASAFPVWSLKPEDIQNIYEQYKDQFGSDEIREVNELRILTRKFSNIYGVFNKLKQQLNDVVINKLKDKGVSMTDLHEVLCLNNCQNRNDVIARAEQIIKTANAIYQDKKIDDSIRNSFVSLFGSNSNNENNVTSFFQNELSEKLAYANWVVVKYVAIACRLMDSGAIRKEDLQEIPASQQVAFADAMSKLFGVSYAEAPQQNQESPAFPREEKPQEPPRNNIPEEIELGNQLLKKSDFKGAEKCFTEALKKSPYCWQGYWGLFKASIEATDDDSIYFRGFLADIEDYKDGHFDNPTVKLYCQAKDLAIEQHAPDINFFLIEENYRKVDAAFAVALANEHIKNVQEQIQKKRRKKRIIAISIACIICFAALWNGIPRSSLKQAELNTEYKGSNSGAKDANKYEFTLEESGIITPEDDTRGLLIGKLASRDNVYIFKADDKKNTVYDWTGPNSVYLEKGDYIALITPGGILDYAPCGYSFRLNFTAKEAHAPAGTLQLEEVYKDKLSSANDTKTYKFKGQPNATLIFQTNKPTGEYTGKTSLTDNLSKLIENEKAVLKVVVERENSGSSTDYEVKSNAEIGVSSSDEEMITITVSALDEDLEEYTFFITTD